MPGVTINGSEIYEVIAPGHVTYKIEEYIPRTCTGGYDENGNCRRYSGGYWTEANPSTGSIDAKITGYISAPSSRMKVQGSNIAKVGDITIEQWEATSSIPSSNDSYRYTATSPTQDSGQGQIISGSTKGKLDGKAIALIGSTVQTCIPDVTTTIKTGNEKMKFSS
ncbi:hypothetical protein MKX50_15260 [Paenibacillus sp. FSL W8-0186]|uniref:Uncharacterized protein n=1 Tax=Paenibacillus woosongensis TaxID=307580 RepID=A0ABQ4MQ54_9BACL|nr:hypothetical protein [Paenibacillus woosongensis]GIP58131.1 hypothetical protein J15TS10_19450 [Paenibacillus woosongensis]